MHPNLFNANLAEIEVRYKTKVKFKEMQKISTSSDAEKVFRSIWSDCLELREEFYMLLLNKANRVLGWYRVSEGGLSGTVADPRLIFSIALKCNASGILVAHNHPSGNIEPSKDDINLTKKLREAGNFLDIKLFDHIILTVDSYLSFADEGLV